MSATLESLLASQPMLAEAALPIMTAVPMSLLLAYAGLGFMVGTFQMRGVSTRRSAYDKCARQLASVALLLGWILLVGSRALIFLTTNGYMPDNLIGNLVELGWGSLALAVLTTTIHYAIWKASSNHRRLHAALAYVTGVNAMFGLAAFMGALRLLRALALPNATQLSFTDLFIFLFPSPLTAGVAELALLPFSLAASCGLVWLLMRRNRDDFGRDYYARMLPEIASWAWKAAVFGLMATGFGAATDFLLLTAQSHAPTNQDIIRLALRVVPLLLALFFWIATARAENPMRTRFGLVLAFLLSLATGYFAYADAMSFVF